MDQYKTMYNDVESLITKSLDNQPDSQLTAGFDKSIRFSYSAFETGKLCPNLKL